MSLPLPAMLASPSLDPHPPQQQPQPHAHAYQHQHQHQHQHKHQHQHPHPHPHSHRPRQPKSPVATSPPRLLADASGSPFPFSLTRSIQPNPSSTSIVPSVAQGRPIPLDDTTTEHRTTALRELNSHYPSRHRYAKSTGAESSTYSEPVIVRSHYAAPSPPSRSAVSSGASRVNSGAASVTGSSTSRSAASSSARGLPFSNALVPPGHGTLSKMVLSRGKKPVNGRAEDEARLPPVDAFTFKSFIANMEAQGGGGSAGGINADLDRIAEICARSRYSLSNQYEVHFTPHGSGSSLPSSAAQPNQAHGPTLQAVTSDDERNGSCSRRKRRMIRRNSRAMGTLETIISSSRSSDEERSADRSAAEIADEVRGRASLRDSSSSTPNSRASPKAQAQSHHSLEGTSERLLERERPVSPLRPPRSPAGSKLSVPPLALIDSARRSTQSLEHRAARSSSTTLVSQLALPQASASQLEIVTVHGPGEHCALSKSQTGPKHPGFSLARGAITPVGTDAGSGILSMIHGWIPWRTSSADHPRGLAEGSLRQLLKSTDGGGKHTGGALTQ